MTESEKIIYLRNMIGSNEEPFEVLQVYLEIAASSIINHVYPFEKEIKPLPDKYIYKQLEIATYLLNKRGAEGQLSHKENSIDRVYESGSIPNSLLSDIIPKAGLF